MERKFRAIDRLRSQVMMEVARMAWDGTLAEELDLLPERLKSRNAGLAEGLVEEEINLALGLSADNREDYQSKLQRSRQEKGQRYPLINHISSLCGSCTSECQADCPEGAIVNQEGRKQIDPVKCSACGLCLSTCIHSALADKVQFAPLLSLLRQKKNRVYALLAPAAAGQFGAEIGQLRTALKLLGFHELVEVALFADLLTILEAYEFDHKVKTDEDYMITSCCCPVWINTIEKNFPELLDRVVPSVSPMIAGGRVIKRIDEDALVVFIGPCAAKKKEALEPDLKGAVDFVLTFKELQAIFQALKVDPAKLENLKKSQASWAGLVYGRSGGVSAAISLTLEAIAPSRAIKLRSKRADGIKGCREVLQQLAEGKRKTNFIEGMGCRGGCIGGPGRIVDDLYEAAHAVDDEAEEAKIKIPINNPMVYVLLRQLGMNYKAPSMVNGEPLRSLLYRHNEKD
ncbi:MAG: [Fe-Fe] hydrogenase large subunit C-terminal domain-containing protein [bacterium]